MMDNRPYGPFEDLIKSVIQAYQMARIEVDLSYTGRSRIHVFISDDHYVLEVTPDGECGADRLETAAEGWCPGYKNVFDNYASGSEFLLQLIAQRHKPNDCSPHDSTTVGKSTALAGRVKVERFTGLKDTDG